MTVKRVQHETTFAMGCRECQHTRPVAPSGSENAGGEGGALAYGLQPQPRPKAGNRAVGGLIPDADQAEAGPYARRFSNAVRFDRIDHIALACLD